MMKTRHDGSTYPDVEAEAAVLADVTDPGSGCHTSSGWAYDRTLGDLIIAALGGKPFGLDQAGNGEPEEWETPDHALLVSTAVELRALNYAMATGGDLTCDDGIAQPFTADDAQRMLCALSMRLEAGAELCARLRRARWGQPNYGGVGKAESAAERDLGVMREAARAKSESKAAE